VNTYLIAGRRTIRVEADECTTRTDGSLWFLVATAPRPAALVPVLILAKNEWHSVLVEGVANVLFISEPPPAKPEPRLIP